MKLNNKGLTLIELIISVVLISVVMLFMYGLLNDANDENNDNSFARDNQINRSEIIKEVEEEFLTRRIDLTDIVDESTDDTLKATFKFSDGTSSVIEARQDNLRYTNTKGEMRKWTMQNATLNIDKAALRYDKSSSEAGKGIYSFLLTIEVYTDNDANRICPKCVNNVVDDIIISYVGNHELNESLTCLGHACENSGD